ncbi:hypothetical protein PUN28_006243 [Cardiocondyla obscurior]|uniref:Uncharacterized protein n=1 Tax=Cardiocondyla obscurior TaxID=286306 RepID=A0AAW2G7Q8_9HYME
MSEIIFAQKVASMFRTLFVFRSATKINLQNKRWEVEVEKKKKKKEKKEKKVQPCLCPTTFTDTFIGNSNGKNKIKPTTFAKTSYFRGSFVNCNGYFSVLPLFSSLTARGDTIIIYSWLRTSGDLVAHSFVGS